MGSDVEETVVVLTVDDGGTAVVVVGVSVSVTVTVTISVVTVGPQGQASTLREAVTID